MQSFPLTVRRSIELIGLVVLGMVIVYGQQIIMPLLMAFFTSIVLLPVYRFLIRIKFPSVLAIFLALLLMVIIIAAIMFFIMMQTRPVVNDFATIKQNIIKHINELSLWFSEQTNISAEQQSKFVNEQSRKILDSAGRYIGGAAGSVGSVIVFFGLLPIYTFLMLLYKDILKQFVYLWFPLQEHAKIKDVLKETESIIKSYIVGLLIQITYITVLLGGGLLIMGIPYALLIGIIFAILNLIPYIGALFGNILGVLLTLSSSPDLSDVITVLVTIAVVQFLDNNILMPRIVGGKVRVNALASLAGVFVGGALAGISGMFLSLPLLAVTKVIFDRTEQFKQWGVLFGDQLPQKKNLLKRKPKPGIR
ncbi:AI-2E family transporter [Parafilimonas sp.]|uniref:AI-2E family transporter n=1 Tax=Parafilimonas sp. TaxID=1969739 RepID=UPI0039E4FD8F